MTALSFKPLLMSLATDPSEQNIYILTSLGVNDVIRLQSTNGAIVSAQSFSFLSGSHDVIKPHIISNNSGYYIIGKNVSLKAYMCQYLFSTSTIAQCQEISTISGFASGQKLISNSQFFLLGVDPVSPYPLHLYLLTFGNTAVNWANKIECPSGTCTLSDSETLLVEDGKLIYSFFTFGSTRFMYLVSFTFSSGNVVNSRYKSSVSCTDIWGSAMNGNNIIVTAQCTSYYLYIFKIDTGEFISKLFSGYLYECGLEPVSKRFIVGGSKNSNGYITKFMVYSIDAHPDFSSSSITMSILPTGIEDIITESGVTIQSIASESIIASIYSNQTIIYILNSIYISDAYIQISDELFSVYENSINKISPDLTCSLSGVVSISYSLSEYNGSSIPLWIVLNSSTGELTITSPLVASNIDYYFYIDSIISGITNVFHKRIKLTVMNCSNCGSDAAKALSTTTQSVVGATAGVVTISSMMNTSSVSSLWSMVNQIQLFYLLLLTRAYIPNDVQTAITGSGFALNFPDYFPFKRINFYDSALSNFKFELSNILLDPAGIKSNSTIYNTCSFFIILLIAIFAHIFIWVLKIMILGCRGGPNRTRLTETIIWIIIKVFNILTFRYYIRSVLQMNQIMLLSSFNEILDWNSSKTPRTLSLITAFIIFGCCIALIITSIYLSLSKYEKY